MTLSDDYNKRLRSANRQELIAILVDDLRCPIDWGREKIGSSSPILLEKWYCMVADVMPNGDSDANLLKNFSEYLPEPPLEAFDDVFYDDNTLLSLAFNTYMNRDSYRKKYLEACEKFLGLRAQSAAERGKHYTLGATTKEDMVTRSMRDPEVGKMFPNFTVEAQRSFFWEAIADAFERIVLTLEDETEDEIFDDRVTFDAAWQQLFDVDQFRFCVDTMTTIGYSKGKPVTWLIYDVSYHGKIMHCYPALDAVNDGPYALIDDLQGIEEAFLSQRTDWP